MPGITKRKYVGEIMRFNKSIGRALKQVISVLPYEYDRGTILELFKELYPYEWQTINQRYEQYKEKDEFFKKVGKKVRYNPESPEKYFLCLPIIRKSLTDNVINKHKQLFDEKSQLEKLSNLRAKRSKSINSMFEKIKKATELMQEVEPLYIDAFIASYHKKGITTEGKMEIFKELQKYNCEKSIEFFYKLNDCERNDQIRYMAFKHLQDIGRYVKLRKKFKGKKKSYMTEKSDFVMTPADLVKLIENNNIQNKKSYDMFISHSSKDSDIVKAVIRSLNKHGFNIYCDWTSDTEFLKRELVSDYTKVVLQKRMEQSRSLLFVKTGNSIASDWVKFELNYYKQLVRTIYCVDFIKREDLGSFKVVEYDPVNEIIDIKL